MPTIPQEIDCPECEDGRVPYFDGDLDCETCNVTGKVTVIPCPHHGIKGYTAAANGPPLDCMDCVAAGIDADELCNVNHLLTAECIVPAELIALAEASARGEDYDWDRFNDLFQEAR